jgi:hypothetical protein
VCDVECSCFTTSESGVFLLSLVVTFFQIAPLLCLCSFQDLDECVENVSNSLLTSCDGLLCTQTSQTRLKGVGTATIRRPTENPTVGYI